MEWRNQFHTQTICRHSNEMRQQRRNQNEAIQIPMETTMMREIEMVGDLIRGDLTQYFISFSQHPRKGEFFHFFQETPHHQPLKFPPQTIKYKRNTISFQ